MIARHEVGTGNEDVWAQLAAPLPDGVISWRQDGRPAARDGKYFARFVAYIEANTVRERLDSVIPGEWDLTLELLPALVPNDGDDTGCSFKARLQILGVIREDVGFGKDYKQAATDAFKRAAVRFGIGHELYAYEQNWVQVDGDGKYAKPIEDPGEAYARRHSRPQQANSPASTNGAQHATPPAVNGSGPSSIDDRAPLDGADDPQAMDEPSCPKCGGRLWDNRLSKRNPKAPDGKCRSRSCDGVVWKWGEANAARRATASRSDEPTPPNDRDLPF